MESFYPSLLSHHSALTSTSNSSNCFTSHNPFIIILLPFPISLIALNSFSSSIQVCILSLSFDPFAWSSRAETERVMVNFKNSDKQIRLALILIFCSPHPSPFFPFLHPSEWRVNWDLSSSQPSLTLSLPLSLSLCSLPSEEKKKESEIVGEILFLRTNRFTSLCNLNCTILTKWICFSWHRNLTLFPFLQFTLVCDMFVVVSLPYLHQRLFSFLFSFHIWSRTDRIEKYILSNGIRIFMVLKTNYSFDWKWHSSLFGPVSLLLSHPLVWRSRQKGNEEKENVKFGSGGWTKEDEDIDKLFSISNDSHLHQMNFIFPLINESF